MNNSKLYECVMQEDKPIPILEMWESYSGWYWFITEIDKKDPSYCFGLVCGFENEWGYVDKLGPYKVWKVPRQNWSSNSHVKLVESRLIEGLKQ